ncbi:MAG: methyltransferase type 11, partial [Pseudothermotoga sp.]
MSGYYSTKDQQIALKSDLDADRILVICTGGDDLFTKLLKHRAVLVTPNDELLKSADPRSLRILMNPLRLSFAPESFDI